jgi:hypothetical protein
VTDTFESPSFVLPAATVMSDNLYFSDTWVIRLNSASSSDSFVAEYLQQEREDADLA